MLAGQPATEQCIIIDGVNFLNNADIDGTKLPPAGTPNIMMAAGGTQLHKVFEDDGIYFLESSRRLEYAREHESGWPGKNPVAPYHYLCNGQLTELRAAARIPTAGLTCRVTNSCSDSSIARLADTSRSWLPTLWQPRQAAEECVGTSSGSTRSATQYLYQQGTYAPDEFYRLIPSIAMDKKGDIGVGYSFGGHAEFHRGNDSPRRRPAIRRAAFRCTKPCLPWAKRRRQTRCAGKIT